MGMISSRGSRCKALSLIYWNMNSERDPFSRRTTQFLENNLLTLFLINSSNIYMSGTQFTMLLICVSPRSESTLIITLVVLVDAKTIMNRSQPLVLLYSLQKTNNAQKSRTM